MRVETISVALLTAALLTAALLGCQSEQPAQKCERAASRAECEACCDAAGRSGATWVNGDCACHER